MMWKAYIDDELLGSNETQQTTEVHLVEAHLITEINKTGSFNFKILPTHHLRHKIFKLRSQIKVLVDGDTRFKGRVLDTDEDIEGNLSVNTEGSFAYLLDSIIDEYKEIERTPKEQLQWIIDQHNGQVEIYKRFNLGNVTVTGNDVKQKFSNTQDQTSQDAVTNGLVSRFGGHIFIRYSGDLTYIDWLKEDTGKTSQQKFKIGVNIISLTKQVNSNDVFTILKPVGDKGLTIESVNNGSKYIQNANGISEFGRIVRSEYFEGIKKASELLEKGNEYMKKNYHGLTATITLTALDFHVMDDKIENIVCGVKVEIVAEPANLSETYTCSSIDFDFIDPENSSYLFGTVRQSLTDNYRSYKSDTEQTISDMKYYTSQSIDKLGQDILVNARDIEVNARNIEVNAKNIEVNAETIKLQAGDIKNLGAEIEIQKGEIKLRAYQTSVDRIDTVLYGDDAGNEGLIGKSQELFTRMNDVEIDINGKEGSIGLKAQTAELYGNQSALRGDYEALSGLVSEQGERVTQAEININSMTGEIDMRVKSTEFNDELEKINNSITITRDGILTKVSEEVSGLTSEINVTKESITSTVSDIKEDLSSEIKQTKDAISLKVNKGDVINEINLDSSGATIKASRINLQGYVTAETFATLSAYTYDLAGGHAKFTNVNSSAVNCSGTTTTLGLSATAATISNLTLGSRSVQAKSINYVTDVSVSTSRDSEYVITEVYSSGLTAGRTIRFVTDVSVDYGTAELKYFGY